MQLGSIRENVKTAKDFGRRGPKQLNSYMSSRPSEGNLLNQDEMKGANEGDQILELINKVQMFQIAVNKINSNLEQRKKEPIFKLAGNGPTNLTKIKQ